MEKIGILSRIKMLSQPQGNMMWKKAIKTIFLMMVGGFLAQYFGLDAGIQTIMTVTLFATLILDLEIPFKKLIFLGVISAFITVLAFISVFLSYYSLPIFIFFTILWSFFTLSLYIFGETEGLIGYAFFLTYFLAAILFDNKYNLIEWTSYAVFAYLIASILLIPKFLERKRYIRKLIASTFKSDNSIHSTYTVRKNLENISLKRNLYNILRLGTYLAGFRGYSNMIKSKLSIPSLNVFKQFLVVADKTGDRIAEIIVREDKNIDLTEFNRYLENINQKSKLTKYKDLKAAATIANDMGGIFNNVNRLLKDESKNLSNFKLHKPSNPLKQIIKANFNLENMYMRHTIRFTIAMTIGLALVHITKSRDALWIIMGILIVLKPDITSTINNMLLRVSFNLLGVILAVILGFLFPHFLLVWLAFIMIFLFRAFLPYYIGPSVMAMTIFIVLLWPHGTIIDNGIARLIDITLGALIALILAYIIFPNRITVDLPLQLAKTFMANSKYGKNVFVSSFSNYDHNRAVSGFNNLILEYNNLQSGIKKLQDSFIDVSEDVKFYNNISTLNYQLSGNISIIATKLELKEYEGPELSLLSNFLQDTMQNMAKAIKGNLKLKIIDENKQNLIKDKLINYEDNNSQDMKQYIHWIIEDVNFLHQIVKEGIESGLFNKYKKLY